MRGQPWLGCDHTRSCAGSLRTCAARLRPCAALGLPSLAARLAVRGPDLGDILARERPLAPFEARIGISCQLNARIITDLQLSARRRISRQLLAYGVPNLGRACKYWTRGGISRQLNARIGISRQLNARKRVSSQLLATGTP